MLQDGKVVFTGSQGDELAARLDMPDGAVRAYALFAHCFTCSKDVFATARISRTLKENGIAVFRFDFTGLGASEGDFANTNFTSNVGDLVAAAEFMTESGAPPSILIGHSLGGAAVLSAAAEIPQAKAVVTIAAPSNAAHVAHHFAGMKDEILKEGEAEVCLVGRSFRIKKQFFEDIEGIKIEGHVRDLDKALLVMHAPLDQVVGIENAAQIFGWAKHPKSYISLDDVDHLVTRQNDAEYIGRMIVCWAQPYI